VQVNKDEGVGKKAEKHHGERGKNGVQRDRHTWPAFPDYQEKKESKKGKRRAGRRKKDETENGYAQRALGVIG